MAFVEKHKRDIAEGKVKPLSPGALSKILLTSPTNFELGMLPVKARDIK